LHRILAINFTASHLCRIHKRKHLIYLRVLRALDNILVQVGRGSILFVVKKSDWWWVLGIAGGCAMMPWESDFCCRCYSGTSSNQLHAGASGTNIATV